MPTKRNEKGGIFSIFPLKFNEYLRRVICLQHFLYLNLCFPTLCDFYIPLTVAYIVLGQICLFLQHPFYVHIRMHCMILMIPIMYATQGCNHVDTINTFVKPLRKKNKYNSPFKATNHWQNRTIWNKNCIFISTMVQLMSLNKTSLTFTIQHW